MSDIAVLFKNQPQLGLTAALMTALELASQALAPELDLVSDIEVTEPADPTHGEYASNLALVSFNQLAADSKLKYQSPRGWAAALAEELKKRVIDDLGLISKVEVAGPGFINFTVSNAYLLQTLKESVVQAAQTDRLVQVGTTLDKKKIIVEFTDPNPFKEFHIGHLYSNIVGESISRLLESQGAQVQRVCYQGDVGMHVAKSVWGMQQKMLVEKVTLDQLETLSLPEKVQFLGQAYALGATAYEEDQEAAQAMKQINLATFLSAQERLVEEEGWQPQVEYRSLLTLTAPEYDRVQQLYRAGRAWSLAYFETMYARLGTSFKDYYFESTVGEYGVKIVLEQLAKGVFEKSQGAVVFPGEKYGLHTRVFINSLGLPTYEAKELGLAPEKYRRWPYDWSIIITANEIDEYFKVLLAALGQIEPELAAKTTHLSHGIVKLPEGKMSSRTGKVVTGAWLLDEAKSRVQAVLVENQPELSSNEQSVMAEKIGLAAVKFALLKQAVGRDTVFSFDDSLSFQGNSGPYLQYSYVRCQSILNKATAQKNLSDYDSLLSSLNVKEWDAICLAVPELQPLITQLGRFEEVVARAAAHHAPHLVCGYAFTLAQQFSGVYSNHQVLGSAHEVALIAVIRSVASLLQKSMYLIGIDVVNKM